MFRSFALLVSPLNEWFSARPVHRPSVALPRKDLRERGSALSGRGRNLDLHFAPTASERAYPVWVSFWSQVASSCVYANA